MKSYLRGFKRFCSDKFNLALILTVIFLIVGFGFFYTFVTNRAQSLFTNQMLRKEELVVSSGASSIKVFLGMAENSLLLLSRSPSIVSQGVETQRALDKFALDWAGTPVIGAARFDKDGYIRFMGNNIGGPSEIVKEFMAADRSYFIWTETAAVGDTYLNKPLLPGIEIDKPEYIIPFVTPIHKNGKFDGILALAISLPKLTETYLGPLKVSPDYRVYLFHPDGTILAGLAGYAELVGVNYFEYLRDNPYPGSEEALQGLEGAVEDENEGKLDIVLFSTIEKKLIRFIVAYAPVVYDNEHWTLGLAVPISDVLADFNPLRESSIVVFSLFIFMILILSAIGILLARVNQRNAYMDGLKDGKKNKK